MVIVGTLQMSAELLGIELVDHVVYVDDDPETAVADRGDVDIIGLPKEGRAIIEEDFRKVHDAWCENRLAEGVIRGVEPGGGCDPRTITEGLPLCVRL